MATEPKRHHFIPQAYLRAWADDASQVAVRRRGALKVVTPNIKNVGIESGLYGHGDTARQVEKLYGEVEKEWPRVRTTLIDGDAPTNDERELIATFVALQVTRTPDEIRRTEFVEGVVSLAGTSQPSRQHVADYIESHHLGHRVDSQEIEAAWSFVTGAIAMSGANSSTITRLDAISMAVDVSLSELTPRIVRRPWIVKRCRKRLLVTTDRPVTNWVRPSGLDRLRGIGLEDATEVRLPISPCHLLVMGKLPGPAFRREQVKPNLFYDINREAAARCSNMVFASPHRSDYLASLDLSKFGPQLRFSMGPGYRTLPDGSMEPTGRDIIHMYTPRY